MKPEIAVAISGGVDSLITAFILKQKFKQIVGLHFLNGYERAEFQCADDSTLPHPLHAPNRSMRVFDPPDSHPMAHIARQLDIPIKLVDCRYLFQKNVVDYFVESYRRGLTPNPCMVCNPIIKFGIMFDLAKQLGASYFATGHYARVIKKENGLYLLQKGRDTHKDQSYFLALLPKNILPFIHFPLGEMTKQQVREMADVNALCPVSEKESQDVCFIEKNDYARFVTLQDGVEPFPGLITDNDGRKIGTHNGLHRFTVGQRRGINCPAGEPYYVLKIDKKKNRLIVGFKEELYKSTLSIKDMNWFIPMPDSRIDVFVKIRYRHQAAEAVLVPESDDSATIYFKTPQPAIAPGQGAVCYAGDEVIAGGFIYE